MFPIENTSGFCLKHSFPKKFQSFEWEESLYTHLKWQSLLKKKLERLLLSRKHTIHQNTKKTTTRKFKLKIKIN